MNTIRTRWAAIGAAVAVTLGGGGIGLVAATSPSEANTLVQITACRLADTRPASQVGPRGTPLGPDETYTVAAHGSNGNCDIPTSASGLSLNVTAVGPTAATYLTFWDDGDVPLAANLNPTPGAPPTPNAVFVPLSHAGAFHVFNKFGHVDLVIDVNGYTTDHHHDDRYHTRDVTYTRREVHRLLDEQRVEALGSSHGQGLRSLGDSTNTAVEEIVFDAPHPGSIQMVGSGYVTHADATVTSLSCHLELDGGAVTGSSALLEEKLGSCSANATAQVAEGVFTVRFMMRSSGGEGFVQPSSLDVLYVPSP